MRRVTTFSLLYLLLATSAVARNLPDGYWTNEQTKPILDRMQSIKLDPDLSHLSVGEQAALVKLLANYKRGQANNT